MNTAVATPAVVPVRGSAESIRSEVKLIALLVGGLIALGAILQQFIAPGAVSVSLYTALMTVTILAASYVVRGRLWDAIGGFRMAATVLTLLAIAAALGTLVLQNKPVEFYRGELGKVGALILALRLDDLFHSLWFGGLVALLNVGLIASALRRWPVTRRNVGFFSVHLGIIITLAGSAVSGVFSVKGRIDLHVGQAASTVRVTHAGLPTGEEVPLGAAVQLLKFDVDHYADQPRVSLYLPNKKNAGFDLKTTFENELGVKHRLPDGRAFRIKGYYPDLVMSERLQESGGASPALKLTLDGKPIFLMPNERERADSADGKVAVLFGWQRPAAKIDAPLHTVAIAKGEPVPVRLGETVTLAGIKVKALRFFPHFTFDLAKKQAMNVSDTPINPALEVEVDGGKPRWVFANMPGFGHGKEGPELTYAFSPEGGSAAATVVAVGGADKSVLVHHADGTEQTLALTDGLQVEGVQLGALLEKASVVREPSTASQQPNKPAVMVELFEGERAREVLMTAGQQDPVPVGKGYLTFETHVEDVKAFRSEVLVRGAGDPQRAIVAVNDPVPVGAWKLYQVNYDPKDPQYSGLEAVRDPGVNWVFLGFGLLFFGVFYMIYLAPRMRRREA